MPAVLLFVFIVILYNDLSALAAALRDLLPGLLVRAALAVGSGWLYYRLITGSLYHRLCARQDRLVAEINALHSVNGSRRRSYSRSGMLRRIRIEEDIVWLQHQADGIPDDCQRGYAALKAGAWLAALAAFLDPVAAAVAAGIYAAYRLVTR